MKKTDIVKPQALSMPIGKNGQRDVINNTSSGNYCSISEGFPEITMKDILTEGGLPPRGQGANGLFYITSDAKFYSQNGGVIGFDSDVSSAIGGYPEGAVLNYITEDNLKKTVISLIDDNTNSDLSDAAAWKDITPLGNRQITNCILEAPNGVVDVTTTTITAKSGLKFLCANGRNTDETLKNFEHTLSADITLANTNLTDNNVILLTSADSGTTWSLTGLNPQTQYFESTVQPTLATGVLSAVWFNAETSLTKSTADGGTTWTQIFAIKLSDAYCDTTNTPPTITSVVPVNTVRLLNLYDRLTGFSEVDFDSVIDLTFGSSFVVPEDGWVFFGSDLSARTTSSITTSKILVGGYVRGLTVHYHKLTVTGAQSKGVSTNQHTFVRVYKGQTVSMSQVGSADGDTSINSTAFRYFKMKKENNYVVL